MIKCITFFLFLIATFLVLLGIDSLIRRLSYPLEQRFLHYRFIVISFLFICLTSNTVAWSFILPVFGKFINLPTVNNAIKFLIPQRSIELIFVMLCMLVLNIVFATAYLILLCVVKLVSKRLSTTYIKWDSLEGVDKIRHFPWYFVNKFYELDGGVTLNTSGHTYGIFLKRMKYATAVIWMIEIAVMYASIGFFSEVFGGMLLDIVKKVYLLPMTAYFFFEQLQLFLEGPEGSRVGSVSSTDISEEMLGNVESLIPCYHDVFGETGAILCSEKGPDRLIAPPGLISNDLSNDKLANCNDKDINVLNIINSQLQQSGIETNSAFQNAIISLLNGESVFVKDNAEGEFTAYYSSYINYYISLGQKALVLCTDSDMVIRVKEDLLNYAQKANGNNLLWVISTADELETYLKANVVICTYRELLNLDMNVRYKDIADRIHFVVFTDSVGLVGQNNIVLELMLSKLKSLTSLERYIFISDIGNNMVRDRIQQLFYYENISLGVFNTDHRCEHSGAMVWKGESFYELQSILGIGDAQTPYIGTALPLALVALKNDFSKVYIVHGQKSADDYYINNAIPANIGRVIGYIGSQLDISSRIISSESDIIKAEDMKIICVYDDDFNLFNSLWQWFRYAGRKGTIIHVISPFYMMREYYADNYKHFINSNEQIALFKDTSKLDYSRRAMLLALFAYRDVYESELKDITRSYGWRYNSIPDLLIDILKTARASNQIHSLHNYYEFIDEYRFDSKRFKVIRETKVRLTAGPLIDELKERVAPAYIDLGHGNRRELNILKDNVFNYYLRGQVMAYSGQFYMVNNIENGVVYVSTHTPNRIYDYYSISDFVIDKSICIDNCADNRRIDFNILQADVTRCFYGYVASVNGNDFVSRESYLNITSIDNKSVMMRGVPVLELNIRKRLFGNHAEKAVYLLSVLFNGLFKTLFPDSYQNIIAVADLPFDKELCDSIMNNDVNYSGDDLITLTTPAISSVDTVADSNDVRLFIIEFSSLEYGMIDVLYRNIDAVLGKIYDYLNWYMGSQKGSYLNFGQEKISSLFAPDELLKMLKYVLNADDEFLVGNGDNIETSVDSRQIRYKCTFCGRSSYFAWRFGDGRTMCGDCHNHMKTQKDEIKYILISTRNRMIDYYSITISDLIDIKFQSKDAIERVAGKVANGRILGFYDHVNQQLWIERKGPTVAMQSTMAHELTHAWQYDNIDMHSFEKALGKYSKQKKRVLLEGHAVFVQLDVMRRVIKEQQFADRLAEEYMQRDDAYGVGLRLFSEYNTRKLEDDGPKNPFEIMELLVSEIISGEVTIEWPANIKDL